MFTLIFIIIIILYLLLNYLFLSSIFKIFSYKNKKVFLGLIIFYILLFPASIFLHRFSSDTFGKYIYIFWITYIWAILIANYVFIFYRLISLKYKNKNIWYISLIIAIFLLSFSFYSSRSIIVKEINIHSSKIKENKKIVYMSDIHIDTLNDAKYIEKIVEMINTISPDLVLINWDLIDASSLSHSTFAWFNKIKVPIYATFGNHEIYTGLEYVENLLSKTNIKLLRDEKIDFEWIQILGSKELNARNKDIDFESFEQFLKKSEIDPNKPAILLVHEPVGVEISKKYPIDLQLAWHTHDWQIWPFWLIAKRIFWYNYWLYDIWNMKFYVSSWVWTWWPPFRLGTRNEIVVFKIEK